MTAGRGEFTPNNEVDKIKWLTVEDATDRLSYGRDRALLRSWVVIRRLSDWEAAQAGRRPDSDRAAVTPGMRASTPTAIAESVEHLRRVDPRRFGTVKE